MSVTRLWAMGYGLWAMGYGLWAMGYGLWAMGYGLWAMGYSEANDTPYHQQARDFSHDSLTDRHSP
jgi:hypothetical protein